MGEAAVALAAPAATFEELRFVWELYAAEALFLTSFASRRGRVGARLALGLALFSVLSQGYFVWLRAMAPLVPVFPVVVALWYVVLTLLMMAYFRWCFAVSYADTLYVGIISYAAQHVVYAVVHEMLARWLLPQLAERLVAYVALSALVCAAWYGLLYWFFSRRLSLAGEKILEGSPRDVVMMTGLLVIFLGCAFGFQHLFTNFAGSRPTVIWMTVLLCLMVLGLQYANFQAALMGRERAATEQMLREGARHWDLSHELIENVNRSVHDLKHALRALEQLPAEQREGFVNETSEYIRRYESLVYSENEALNTLLSEKALLCENRGISFSCVVGSVDLGFISMPDLYVLLGNTIDNAIEAVQRLSDSARRAITLQVQGRAGLVLITCDNPFEGELRMRGGLPLTSKADASRHGFGLKSIRLIAEKYDGVLDVSTDGGVFTVQISIPAQAW
ncbi:ATP-binding protein [Olsenella sp. An188]|uniref:ATP-binding protein n=1 Tax=Olsenella sp. An188 TaxID=1965579 RepID=UPI000B39AE32|nr:ATP-binding protein [Olsenella sp. An188]OUP39130.1 hypothetical protein B5F23_03145 [Olsenella sp. An188]